MPIVPETKLREKRLRRLMGPDYDRNPAVRAILERLQGVATVDSMDSGRPVAWQTLTSERERKIALTYFWQGAHFADKMRGDPL